MVARATGTRWLCGLQLGVHSLMSSVVRGSMEDGLVFTVAFPTLSLFPLLLPLGLATRLTLAYRT
jgi:hypothetical protein